MACFSEQAVAAMAMSGMFGMSGPPLIPGPMQMPGPTMQMPGPTMQMPGPTMQMPGPPLQMPGSMPMAGWPGMGAPPSNPVFLLAYADGLAKLAKQQLEEAPPMQVPPAEVEKEVQQPSGVPMAGCTPKASPPQPQSPQHRSAPPPPKKPWEKVPKETPPPPPEEPEPMPFQQFKNVGAEQKKKKRASEAETANLATEQVTDEAAAPSRAEAKAAALSQPRSPLPKARSIKINKVANFPIDGGLGVLEIFARIVPVQVVDEKSAEPEGATSSSSKQLTKTLSLRRVKKTGDEDKDDSEVEITLDKR